VSCFGCYWFIYSFLSSEKPSKYMQSKTPLGQERPIKSTSYFTVFYNQTT